MAILVHHEQQEDFQLVKIFCRFPMNFKKDLHCKKKKKPSLKMCCNYVINLKLVFINEPETTLSEQAMQTLVR